MQVLRAASFDEFVHWYLVRECQKSDLDTDLNGVAPEALRKEMRQMHPGKLRPWFERAEWSIVQIESVAEAQSLVCVDCRESRRNGLVSGEVPNRFLAGSIVAAARRRGYFDNPNLFATDSVEWHYRQERIERFRREWPKLQGNQLLTICSMNADERSANPSGTWYLHDGFGRLLSWLYCLVYEDFPYHPIEAFRAKERDR